MQNIKYIRLNDEYGCDIILHMVATF